MNYPIPSDDNIKAYFSQRKIQPEDALWSKVQEQIRPEQKRSGNLVILTMRIAALWFFIIGIVAVSGVYLIDHKNQYTNTNPGKSEDIITSPIVEVEDTLIAKTPIIPDQNNQNKIHPENHFYERRIQFRNVVETKFSEKSVSQYDLSTLHNIDLPAQNETNQVVIAEGMIRTENSEVRSADKSDVSKSDNASSKYNLIKKPKINPAVLLADVDKEHPSGILNKAFKSIQANAENLFVYVGERNKYQE